MRTPQNCKSPALVCTEGDGTGVEDLVGVNDAVPECGPEVRRIDPPDVHGLGHNALITFSGADRRPTRYRQ